MTDLVQSAGRLRPDVRYRVVFTRSIGLPGRIVREGVEVVAPGADIDPFRDFIARIEVDA